MLNISNDEFCLQDVLCFLGMHKGKWSDSREVGDEITHVIQVFQCGHCGHMKAKRVY